MSESTGVARTAGSILGALGWLVLLVGVAAAAASIYFGFQAEEPWAYGGIFVDQDWQSISLGFFWAVCALVNAGVVWAFLQVARVALWHMTPKGPGYLE